MAFSQTSLEVVGGVGEVPTGVLKLAFEEGGGCCDGT
jgi:hypothetical protein